MSPSLLVVSSDNADFNLAAPSHTNNPPNASAFHFRGELRSNADLRVSEAILPVKSSSARTKRRLCFSCLPPRLAGAGSKLAVSGAKRAVRAASTISFRSIPVMEG
jgi:hypothetical protein